MQTYNQVFAKEHLFKLMLSTYIYTFLRFFREGELVLHSYVGLLGLLWIQYLIRFNGEMCQIKDIDFIDVVECLALSSQLSNAPYRLIYTVDWDNHVLQDQWIEARVFLF